MIKCIAIDDDKMIREDIKDFLNQHFSKDLNLAAEATNVEGGVKAIEEHEPDLVFLDIHLADGTGFDVVAKSNFKDFDIIFITGFDVHAIKAIKIGALDYILKPFDEVELMAAVNKSIQNSNKEKYLEKLTSVSHEFFTGSTKKRIILRTNDIVHAVFEDDIIYCKADGNYTDFYTATMGRIVVSKPIKHMEELLSEGLFVRCHQSYIVNRDHVVQYNKDGVLVLRANFEVPVSVRRKEFTLNALFG